MLPSKRFIIERFFTIRQNELDISRTYKVLKQAVINQLSEELHEPWIYMNVYPINVKHIKVKVEKFIDDFLTIRSTIPAKRKDTWQRRFSDLKLKLDNGFNIRTREYQTQKHLEKAYDVKIADDDEDFYLDSLKPVLSWQMVPTGNQVSASVWPGV